MPNHQRTFDGLPKNVPIDVPLPPYRYQADNSSCLQLDGKQLPTDDPGAERKSKVFRTVLLGSCSR